TAVLPPRTARLLREQERLRAGRVRILLGAAGRRAGLRLPGPGRGGRRLLGGHGGGVGSRSGGPPSAGGDDRRRWRPVRVLHAGLRGGDHGPPPPEPVPFRVGGPRGALRQPLPLHRVRPHLRGSPASGRGPEGVSLLVRAGVLATGTAAELTGAWLACRDRVVAAV